jgi:hypothetical protein
MAYVYERNFKASTTSDATLWSLSKLLSAAAPAAGANFGFPLTFVLFDTH